MKQIYKYIIMLLLFSFTAKGNNLQVSDVQFADQNVGTGEVSIQFDISWDNSWRTSTTDPYNWDAVWLFAKYKSVDGTWYHATLSQNNNSTGQGTPATLSVRGDSVGAYLYRSGDGTGTFSSNDVKLRWDYEANGIGCNLGKFITEVKVFAIEMVYIPQGAFYVGSGGDENEHFYTYGGNNPYHITSEAPIIVGTANGNLYYSNINFGGDRSGPIPLAFPKGYNSIYCMKYEITQQQYSDFLNTLTRSQQDTRTGTYLASGVMSVSNRYVMSNSSSLSYRNGIRCDATIPATTPITFYCDFNGNGVPNESSDGQNIACNYLSWADGTAYSDWSGLRPMTELEYEKACRGPLSSVANEYAWGSTFIVFASTNNSNITNSGHTNEGSSVNGANCNSSRNTSYELGTGPLRVGCFGGSSRQSSGATYYGVMDMSGNLLERSVTVGNSMGRAFIGDVGDGTLNASGNADIPTCPSIDATGSGFRGGGWDYLSSDCSISGRRSGAFTHAMRYIRYSFRCVGSAENSAVNMCGQIWSKKNLNVITYRNGDTIPQVSNPSEWCNLTTGAWCYYDNNPANGEVYGKMYNWYAVTDPRGLAPDGWHIPTDQEFKTFELCLGMTQSESDAVGRARGTIEGGKIKSLGTIEDGNGLWNAPNTGATNEYDFSVIPGGYRNYEGAYVSVGLTAHFWTNTPANANQAYHRSLINNGSGIFRFIQKKYYGFYVRCIKD